MKSCDPNLQGLYLAILEDCQIRYPGLSKDWKRDSSRLRLLFNTRGDSFFTLDLPALGKHYDRCVADGRLTLSGLPGGKPFKQGYLVPRLFKGLVLRVFDISGSLRQDVDTHALFLLRTLCYGAKKHESKCSDSRIRDAVKEYFDVEKSLPPATLAWEEDSLCESPDQIKSLSFKDLAIDSGTPQLSLSLGEPLGRPLSVDFESTLNICHFVCDSIVGGFPEFDYSGLKTKHGPGAVSDKAVGGSKYSFPNWPRKLDNTFPASDYGVANIGTWLEKDSGDYDGMFVNHEPPSKLLAVPKTKKSPRIIASEPIAHQWLQQGTAHWLTEAFERGPLRHCVSIWDQTHNGALALSASHTGSHGTIDLSAASDRVSCWLVERCFRSNPDFLIATHASRTRWMNNTVHSHFPKYFKLRKFAAMGSALTFPTQSVIFAMLSISAVIRVRGLALTKRNIEDVAKEVRVYGDDMIVPTDACQVLIEILTYLGLKVNSGKTYLSGKFRESCGVDAYDGVDVTPPYYKRPYKEADPTSLSSIVECGNNFFRKGLVRAARFLEWTLPRKVRKHLLGVSETSGTFGILRLDNTVTQRRRFNRNLHQYEVKGFVLSSSDKRKPTKGSYCLLQYFTEAPEPTTMWKAGVAGRPEPIARLRWVPIYKL